jgi:apolipoprotein N-acyltransferase
LLKISHQSWILAILSAVLQTLIFPSVSWSWLSWVAFVPLLVALLDDDLSSGQGFAVAYGCGVLWYAGTCFWIFHTMHVYGNLSTPVAVIVVILFCFYLGIYHGLFGWLLVRVSKRTSRGVALAAAPFLWVAVELARYHITSFPWDLLGTAVVDNLLLTRLATYTAVYGLSFLIVVVNALVAAFFLVPSRLAGALGVIAAVGAQGGMLYRPVATASTHEATLVQVNLPILSGPWPADYFDATIAELVQASRTFTRDNTSTPRLIIWPESPAPFYLNDPKFRTWMVTLAADQKSYIIAGTLGTGPDQKEIFNSASLVSPTGAFVDRYDKIRLVPFGEYVPFQQMLFFAESLTREVSNFSRGNARHVFQLEKGTLQPPGTAGVFICYESVFPDEVRQFAANGAQVFVNISNDEWFGPHGAPGQHLNMARMRAIENGRWVLRATNSGVTSAIDPYGRVVARAERDRRIALRAPYAFVTDTTFYTRHGDWFAYLCAIITSMAVFMRTRVRGRHIHP